MRVVKSRRLLAWIGLGLFALASGAGSLAYYRSVKAATTIAGIMLGDTRLSAIRFDELAATVAKQGERFLDGAVTLHVGASSLAVRRRELGARVDIAATSELLRSAGRSGELLQDLWDRLQARRSHLQVPFIVRVDHDVALAFFTHLKDEVDRPPVPSGLDLDHQTVLNGKDGYVLRVYDCLVAAELALREGRQHIQLAATVLPAVGKNSPLLGLDISHVLGQFATVYSLAEKDKDRAHNLAVGASKLDGHVIAPGAELSFNKVVGQRTEAEGYRTAPVITEGELVDGMAGGACQLSSTLFAASFFAGLDLISSRPHTRPSSYIKMGLDAAVAYPSTDLVVRNPYSFPVVVHYKVNQGKVQVRILGKQRPWRKVAFVREVKQQIPFHEETRNDPKIPRGQRVITQVGVPGFTLERRRLFYKAGSREPARVEARDVRYPPTTQYLAIGVGPPDPKWEPPQPHAPLGDVPPVFTLEQ